MIQTNINLQQVIANAKAVRQRTGVAIYGVVKANGYGCGARSVAEALTSHVDGWYVFSADEVIAADLWAISRKTSICTVVPDAISVEALRSHHIRPAVWTIEQLERWRDLDPLLCIDTGMQRFACPPEQIEPLLAAHKFTEAFTHASRPAMAHELKSLLGGRGIKLHAAASSLINDPTCWLDAVRPGLTLYENAVRVTTRLIDARISRGAIGYTQFSASHHGVILGGYSNGMKTGVCVVNGRRQRIIEVGMQSSFVTLDAKDKAGDEVVLLGDQLSLAEAAEGAKSSPHETLVRLASSGKHEYTRQ